MMQQKNRQIPLFSSTTKDLSPDVQHIIIRRISEDLSSLKEELHDIVDSPIDEEIESKKVEVDDCLRGHRIIKSITLYM